MNHWSELDSDEEVVHKTHSCIPEGAAKLNGFQKYWLCLLEGEVVAQTEADAHGTKAWRWNFNVCERKRFDHFDEVREILSV